MRWPGPPPFVADAAKEGDDAQPGHAGGRGGRGLAATQQGLTLAVHAVIVFKVGDDAIVDASKTEMARIGLAVDSLQISSIDDKGAGYIKALAAPHQARVNQAAKVAQAAADQASAMAQQESMRNQAEYARQTAIAQAQYQAEIDQAQQTAAQAGPLAAAQAQQDVLVEQALVAQKNAELRQAELIAEVIRPGAGRGRTDHHAGPRTPTPTSCPPRRRPRRTASRSTSW